VFRKVVVDAVSHWRFKPATRDGVPIAMQRRVFFPFRIGSALRGQ
jgi:hypothetical protein